MSATTIEWLAVALFFICFFAFTVLESYWLNKKENIPFGKAFSYAFATNTVSISIGFFVSFVIFLVIFMLVWDGSAQKLPARDLTLGVAVALGALFPIVLLILTKRVMLRIFKMSEVRSPWLFSIAAAVTFFLLVSAVPFAFIYAVH